MRGRPTEACSWAECLAYPTPITLTYRPGGAHPTAYLRVRILVEMLRRIGFARDAGNLQRVWERLYRPTQGHRIPAPLLGSASSVIPHVVDEIAFQTRRNLAQRAVVDVIPFRRDDEAAIRAGARCLIAGRAVQPGLAA